VSSAPLAARAISPVHSRLVEALVRETETPTQIVRELFLEEIAALASTARITQYVGIIASRRVRLRLRANHHRRATRAD
jgi:hypothetical protein